MVASGVPLLKAAAAFKCTRDAIRTKARQLGTPFPAIREVRKKFTGDFQVFAKLAWRCASREKGRLNGKRPSSREKTPNEGSGSKTATACVSYSANLEFHLAIGRQLVGFLRRPPAGRRCSVLK